MHDQVEYGHKDVASVTSTTEEDMEISNLVEATSASKTSMNAPCIH